MQCVHYILTGIEKGLDLVFSDTEVTCHSAEHNLLSASRNPEVVSKYLVHGRYKVYLGHSNLILCFLDPAGQFFPKVKKKTPFLAL